MRQAYTADSPRQFEIREAAEAAPGPGEVRVRVRNCGICGSDLHDYREAERWRGGRCLGHEISGQVAAVGEGVTEVVAGDAVCIEPLIYCGRCEYCLAGNYHLCPERVLIGVMLPGGYADSITVPASTVYRLPEGVGFPLGALAEPLAVAVHGARVAASMTGGGTPGGDRVVVLGAGTLGLLAAFYARQSGAADLAITARHGHQADLARQLGATRVFGTDEDGAAELREWASAHPVDAVVEAVGGSAGTLNQALRVVRPGGRISVLGVFTEQVRVQAMQLVLKEPRLTGAITYARSGAHSDYDVALGLLRRFGDVLGNLITHRVALDDLARGFELAADKSSGSIKVTVEP